MVPLSHSYTASLLTSVNYASNYASFLKCEQVSGGALVLAYVTICHTVPQISFPCKNSSHVVKEKRDLKHFQCLLSLPNCM